MVDNPFIRVGSLLSDVPGLEEDLAIKVTNTQQAAWRAAAGNDISNHTVVKPNKDCWQVIADSPVWGDAVRQRHEEILNSLHRANMQVSALKIKVRPRATPAPAPALDTNPTSRTLDSETADLLAQTADSLKSPELAEAIRRLSLHRGRE